MVQALRLVSIERGHDPREFALIAFGGAGPLHELHVATYDSTNVFVFTCYVTLLCSVIEILIQAIV